MRQKTFALMTNVIISFFIVLIFAGCGSSDSVAGNGSETGNPRIIGIASEKTGKPAVNSTVTIYKSTYSPFSRDSVYTTTTNSSGRFELELPDTGTYSIVLLNADSSTGIRTSCRLANDSALQLGSITLEGTKTVILRRKITDNSQDFYAEGSSITARFAEGSDSVILKNVPIGFYNLIDSTSGTSSIDMVIKPSDPEILTMTIKPSILVIASFGWDSSSNAVSQVIKSSDSTKYRLIIADSREAEIILTSKARLSGVVILFGSEQNTDLVTALDTSSLPILVSSSNWYVFLHMTADTGVGMESTSSILLDGQNQGTHPILSSMGVPQIVLFDVVDSPVLLSWGKPQSTADVIAYGTKDQSMKFIFSYEKDDAMFGKNAPARRVGFPFGMGKLSETGETVFSNTLNWFCNQE